jgi:hypothetical protein
MMRYIYSLSLFVLVPVLILCSIVLSTNKVEAGIGPVEGCFITIIKEALPADNTPFEFEVSGTGGMFSFTLSDPSKNSMEFFLGFETSVDVTEMVPEDWKLVDIKCSGIGVEIVPIENGQNFTCLKIFDMASCTFENEGPPPSVPTLSQWGLIAMAGILGIVGFMVIRRRKATA